MRDTERYFEALVAYRAGHALHIIEQFCEALLVATANDEGVAV